jgi:hypothetical protein
MQGLAGNEMHGGQRSPVAAKSPRDLRWMAEGLTDGGAKWLLAGGDWAAVAYLGDGENGEREEALADVFLFIGGGESGPGPTRRRRTADGLLV